MADRIPIETQVAAMIPHELVVEILTWLPAIHLWPLRLVSKTWFNLLTTDHNFANLHFTRAVQSNSNPSILARKCSLEPEFYLAVDYTECAKAISLGFPIQEGRGVNYYSLIGISNGLICIVHSARNEVYIWNPIIKDHITISYLGIPSPTHFGFGFHQDINAYKLVKLVPRPKCPLLVSLWTLGVDSSSWRSLEDDNIYNVTFIMDTPSPVVNGCIHWLASRGGLLTSTILLSFDLKDEVTREIAIPSDLYSIDLHDNSTEIREIGGCLYICCVSRENGDLQIWAMDDYGVISPWRKLRFGKPQVGDFLFQLHPLVVVGSTGEIILEKISGVIKGVTFPNMKTQLILYNLTTELITNLKEFSFELYRAYMYIGSIISPRVIIEAGLWLSLFPKVTKFRISGPIFSYFGTPF
ncbi:hypothetical protein ACHQM5_027576 [Ranunculus cassubicifolius]